MKKAVFATFVAIAGISCILAHQSHSKATNANLLTLSNVEALSQSEAYVDYDDCCTYSSNRDDICVPNSGPILYGHCPC